MKPAAKTTTRRAIARRIATSSRRHVAPLSPAPAFAYTSNPFDHSKREIHRLRRPTSIRNIVRGPLKHATGVYDLPGIGRRRTFHQPTVCWYNGRKLMRSEWRSTIVFPGDVVLFQAVPEGMGGQGGGGGSGQIVMVVAMIAIAVAAPYLGGALAGAMGFAAGSIGANLVTMGVGLALTAAVYGISSLFVQPPPPVQQSVSGGYGDVGQSSPTYSANIQGNMARLGQPIPAGFGYNVHVPDRIGSGYYRYVDNVQYAHCHYGVGHGSYDLEEPQIGDTKFSHFRDVTYEHLEPNETPDPDICDPRIWPSPELTDVELLDEATEGVGANWVGPFPVCPPQMQADRCEIDTAAPRGLYDLSGSGIANMSVPLAIEAQLIDDEGAPIGDPGTWTSLGTPTKTARSTSQLFWTDEFELPSAGRWQVRMRRTDTKSTATNKGHQLDWIGLKGRLIVVRKWPLTVIAVKAKITSQLNGRQLLIKVPGTRKLATWDGDAGAMTTEETATRSPLDALAEISRNTVYGGRIPLAKIDLAGIYALSADLDPNWTFDFVFDQTITLHEALGRVTRSIIGQHVVQGGKLRVVRDLPTDAPPMMFTAANTRRGSVNVEWVFPDDTKADHIIGTYWNLVTGKPAELTVAFDDSPQAKPSYMTLHGITYRPQAWAVLWNLNRSNRYRNKLYKWNTAPEGLIAQFGERVSFSTDIVSYGQHGQIKAWDEDERIATLTNTPRWTEGETHYIALRDEVGMLAAVVEVTAHASDPNKVMLGEVDLPDIFTGNSKRRTYYQFGVGEDYGKRLIVREITPLTMREAAITAFDDDPRMHDELPDLPDDTITATFDDIDVTIPNGTGATNLRTYANAHGYVGVTSQSVTIRVEAGSTVGPLTRGSWPVGAPLFLVIDGTVVALDGTNGTGGDGSLFAGLPGTNGGTGGNALDVLSGPITLSGSGTLRAGKGGGGGGGQGGAVYYEDEAGGHYLGGGAGGAGNGSPGGLGGSASGATSGTGGNGGAPGASPGDAGTAGSPGEMGTGGATQYAGGAGGLGGAGGKAIVGIANVTGGGSLTLLGGTA